MKNWPENDEPASFEELVSPLIDALRFAYDLKRKNRDKDIPYRGFDHGALAYARSADEKLKAEQMQYAEDEQGRDGLTEIIGLAVMVGIEQGRRLEYSSQSTQRLLLKVLMDKLENDA